MKWFDFLMMIIIVLSSIGGYRRGFVLTMFSLGSYIIAFFVARIYYPKLSEWIRSTPFLIEGIQSFIGKNINLELTGGEELNEGALIKLPLFLEEYVLKEVSIDAYAQQTIEVLQGQIVSTLVTFFINIVSMIFLFVAARAAILIVGHLINKFFQLSILNTVNSLGGGLLGFVRGFIIIFIMVLILIPIAMINLEGFIAKGMQESNLLPMFSQHFLSNLFINTALNLPLNLRFLI